MKSYLNISVRPWSDFMIYHFDLKFYYDVDYKIELEICHDEDENNKNHPMVTTKSLIKLYDQNNLPYYVVNEFSPTFVESTEHIFSIRIVDTWNRTNISLDPIVRYCYTSSQN